jgi:hypothetical protein
VPISACMVTLVTPETSQLMVVFCPALMLAGLTVKEFMIGLAAPAGPVAVQPAIAPANTVNEMTARTSSFLHLFIFTSVFIDLYLASLDAVK